MRRPHFSSHDAGHDLRRLQAAFPLVYVRVLLVRDQGGGSFDDVRRRFILPLWNSYAFFATYAALDRFDPQAPENQVPLAERSVLDRWILSQLHQLVAEVRGALNDYAPDRAARAIERFTIDELSNWYIRRNRRRFWKSENDADKAAAYQTLYESLNTLARLLAPFTPFLAEAMYELILS